MHSVQLHKGKPDEWFWLGGNSGLFSTRSTYSSLDNLLGRDSQLVTSFRHCCL